MKYKLTVSEKQAKVISFALDFYSRISGGQFDEIFYRFIWKNINDDERSKVREMLNELKFVLTGLKPNQPNMGLGKICEDGKIAYDLHQVIRHQLAKDNPNEPPYSIDLDPPMKYSKEIPAKIEPL
ncbi:MAG: hypothetical protein A3F13_02420 [Gammaproteobacteria bacterium RIFCSPHIGHO2_12_FULL_40_19]|nr:MAG: hypothetical protein A3F13_02420 [Gammaproteobacteria bacterium RIFCSPHIGHO2_12_FULL_40_19]